MGLTGNSAGKLPSVTDPKGLEKEETLRGPPSEKWGGHTLRAISPEGTKKKCLWWRARRWPTQLINPDWLPRMGYRYLVLNGSNHVPFFRKPSGCRTYIEFLAESRWIRQPQKPSLWRLRLSGTAETAQVTSVRGKRKFFRLLSLPHRSSLTPGLRETP